MAHKTGSVGWLLATQTAAHLRDQANLITTADPKNDGEFALIIAFALRYWGVDMTELAQASRAAPAVVHGWAVSRNLPDIPTRERVIRWIAHNLRTRVVEINQLVESPVVQLSA